MPPLPPSSSDPSILFNRHAVALAKSHRLIASWLPPHPTTPPTTADNPEDRKQAEQEQEELDDIIFTPVPERLGVGAKVPKTDGDANGHGGGHGYEEDGLKKTETMKGNEKLKIQLLGRDYAQKIVKGKMKSQAGKDSASTSILATGAEKRPPPARTRREEDHIESEDDERGRSSLGKSKCGVLRKRRRLEGLGDGGLEHEDGVEGEGVVGYGLVRLGTEKRRSGYLDEVLADRAKRKRKKGRRKEGVGE